MTGRSLPCEPPDPWSHGWDRTERNIAIAFVTVVFLFGMAIAYEIHRKEELHRAFVSDCMEDGHRRYECEALWGQAQGGGHTAPLPTK